MTEISTKSIIDIHNRIIKEFGGDSTPGILSEGNIDFIVFEVDRKKDLFEKGAFMLCNLITSHPFVDGNKRTAFQTTNLVFRNNGYFIFAKDDDVEDCLLKIASYKCTEKEVKSWLKKRARKVKNTIQLQFS
ncbi:MAG: type II toxin-antitoxin system death-on-curing family toxin [Methanosarcinaceae archaeon]|nr:type II toxin-antitoxin system death-on-curing family toxin [Methanosarcinaceae archaeon]